MAKSDTYSRARKLFEGLDVGESISALELANKVGVKTYEEKKKVAAFLSQQAQKGKVKKVIGKEKRMYYQKLAQGKRSRAFKAAKSRSMAKDSVTFGEIGESIVNYIEKQRQTMAKLEEEIAGLKEKLTTSSKQKEEFKRLYQEAEAKIKELSAQQPVAQKTIRLTKVFGK